MATYNQRVDNQYALLSFKYIGDKLHAKQAIDKRIRLYAKLAKLLMIYVDLIKFVDKLK